jgi:hypothetical protein
MNKNRVHDLALLVGSCCSTANRHSLSIKSIPGAMVARARQGGWLPSRRLGQP